MNKKLLLLFQTVIKNKLFSGSFILLAGATISNLCNYAYHLFMGRMLGPVDYGLLASLISLMYIMAVPLGTISLSLVKEVSSLGSKKSKVKGMYSWITAKSIPILILLLLLTIPLSPIISKTLGIDRPYLVFIMLGSGVIGIYATINSSFLQGMQEFVKLSLVGILGTVLKLLTALGLIIAGYGVLGATFSFIITTVIIGFVTFLLIKKY